MEEAQRPEWQPFLNQTITVVWKDGKRKTGRCFTADDNVYLGTKNRQFYLTWESCQSVKIVVPKPTVLKREDLKVGRTYRGHDFRTFMSSNNDRTIVYLSGDKLQYDSDTVRIGRHLPMITVDQFLRWAAADVTKLVAG